LIIESGDSWSEVRMTFSFHLPLLVYITAFISRVTYVSHNGHKKPKYDTACILLIITIPLEKPIFALLIRKFPTFYGNRRYITVFTGPYHEPDEWTSQPHILFFKIHFNIILSSTSKSPKRFHSFGFSDQNFLNISHFSRTWYMPRPSHPPCINHYNIYWKINIISPLIMRLSSASCQVLLSLSLTSKYSSRQVFSQTLSNCSLLMETDQVSHPYKTMGKVNNF
jgi:hypothetical protein